MPLVVSIAQHIGQRAEQQDAARMRDGVPGFPAGTVAVVVADGMGGHAGGAEASRVAADVFAAALARTSHAEPAADVLHRATGEAGRAVHAAARQAGVEDDMGTTLVAAIVEPERFAWVSVGDSAVYHATAGGLARLSTPHTLGTRLDRAVAEGRISADDAAAHAQRHALTSFLGQAHLDEIDGAVEPVALGVGERLVLCSDGLFGTVSDDEMAAVLAAVVPEHAAQALVDAALSRGRPRQDNITALVVTRVGATPVGPTGAAAGAPSAVASTASRPPVWRPLLWLAAVVALAAAGLLVWRHQTARELDRKQAAADSMTAAQQMRDSLAARAQLSDSLRADSLASGDSSAAARPDSARPATRDSARRTAPSIIPGATRQGGSRPPVEAPQRTPPPTSMAGQTNNESRSLPPAAPAAPHP